MKSWEIEHIQKHLHELIKVTRCNVQLIAILLAKGILAAVDIQDFEELTSEKQSLKLYEILLTKEGAYNELIKALNETRQTEALRILKDKPQQLFDGCIFLNEGQNIGQGSLGTVVYKGTFDGRDVAVKRVFAHLLYFDVVKEVDILKKLDNHPNIVRYYAAEKHDHFIYIALELCLRNLQEEITLGFTELSSNFILENCTQGVAYLHENKIIHGDLKPANILITSKQQVKISDFGLSKKIPNDATSVSIEQMGTSEWMAPEILRPVLMKSFIRGVDKMSTASDIFSLGCVFFFVLTKGMHPFGGPDLIYHNIINDKPQITRQLVNEEWLESFKIMISHHPERRPTAERILNDDIFYWKNVDRNKRNPQQQLYSTFQTRTEKSEPMKDDAKSFNSGQKALNDIIKTLKAEVESSVEDQNFLNKDDSVQLLQFSEEKALHQFDAEVLRIGTAEEKTVEEKAIFLKKVRDYLTAWERKNNEKRAKATTEAEQIVQNCTELYESEMTKSLKNLHTKEDLLQEHERVKLFAMEQFQAHCTTKNSLLVAQCIQKIEQRVDEMSQEIREHFDMIQQSNEIGLLAALFDAKSFYSEKMDQSFKNNKNGYFDAKEFQRMGDQAHQATLKSISANHKLNQNQKKKLDVQLQNLFHKYKQQNAAIKGSYNDKEVALGIDLGTTYCCVAAYHMGKVKIIRNVMGNNITPSYVTINKDGTKVVGDTAKKQAFQNPESTVFDAKRMIGRPMNDKKLQEDMKLWPFTVEEKDGKPQIRVHDKYYHPEQISAIILMHMKDEAEDLLKVKVKKAVITVPAYFTDGQRQATIDAGELAGLQVLGILNEPTAAAVAYRLEWKNLGKARNILVYDLGGRTFDVAILRIDDNKMDVLAVNGNSHLGGEDFDRKMMLHCAQAFKTKNGVDLLLGKDSQVRYERDEARRRMKRLQLYCEDAKKALSTAPSAYITVDEIMCGHDLSVDVKRKEFEDMNAGMFQTTIKIVEEAIKSARLKKEDIDDVVLVGGSTRIKRVQQLLENYFDGKALNKEINPDEAVAYGAAVQAAILNANPGAKLFDFGLIQEVTPMSLGIESASKEMDVIIPKNTKIPVSRNEEYRTFTDGQTSVTVRIYQGEERMAADNRLLGTLVLNAIPPGPAGAEVVDVTMHINQNGILSVEAVCRSTKGRNSIIVSEDKGRSNKEEKKRLRDEYN